MAKFTGSKKSAGAFASETVNPVTGLAISGDTADQMTLTWNASTTSYVTGYKVYRSTSTDGPWTLVKTLSSRTTTTYTDLGVGVERWYYRVDSIARNWIGPSATPLAPMVQGSFFSDGFDNTAQTNLNGQSTEAGDLVWKVISGTVIDGRNSGAYGGNSAGGIAVIDMPTQNVRATARAVDGIEAIVARALDGKNYVWVGGNGDPGSLEVAEVRNGVRTVLKSMTIPTSNNIRLELIGDTYTIYDGVSDSGSGGNVVMTVKSSYLLGTPGASGFGVGFINSTNGIAGYFLNALP